MGISIYVWLSPEKLSITRPVSCITIMELFVAIKLMRGIFNVTVELDAKSQLFKSWQVFDIPAKSYIVYVYILFCKNGGMR